METFNMPNEEELSKILGTDIDEPTTEITEREEMIKEIDDAIDKIDAALPFVNDLNTADEELDNLANMATERFEDLVSLGLNVDARYSGGILQTASSLLSIAVTAKQAKIDKKLKMIQLQLQKAKLDQTKVKAKSQESDSESDNVIEGNGMIIDRNELLKMITEQGQKTSQVKHHQKLNNYISFYTRDHEKTY